MISSSKKIKYLLLSLCAILLVVFTSCNKTVTDNNKQDSGSSIPQNLPTTESNETTDSIIIDSSEPTESTTPIIDVKDNPGDGGYTWSPGEH